MTTSINSLKPITAFAGGSQGTWKVESQDCIVGDPLDRVEKMNVSSSTNVSNLATWILHGVESNLRYTHRTEKNELDEKSPTLGRSSSLMAALIPIKKSDAWWLMTQDERRQIFEETSNHIKTGARFLPAIARKLYHSRDLGGPFDFLTWFEFSPSDSEEFERLLALLRATEEWKFVVRESTIRLSR